MLREWHPSTGSSVLLSSLCIWERRWDWFLEGYGSSWMIAWDPSMRKDSPPFLCVRYDLRLLYATMKKRHFICTVTFILVHFCYQWHLTEFVFQPVTYTYFQASGNVSYLDSNHSLICTHSTILFKTECCLTYGDETKTMQPASSWVLVFSYWRWIQYQKGMEFSFAWMEVFTDMVFLPTMCYSLAEPFTHHPMKYPLNI